MNTTTHNRFNPSRKECEQIIKRILQQELEQRGSNSHFRHSVDFLPFFESLYPSSIGLSKQVQRAVRSMNLPKDSKGFFIMNRSQEELMLEQHLIYFFQYEKVILSYYDHSDLGKCLQMQANPAIYEYCLLRIKEYLSYSIEDLKIWIENSILYIFTTSMENLESALQKIQLPIPSLK